MDGERRGVVQDEEAGYQAAVLLYNIAKKSTYPNKNKFGNSNYYTYLCNKKSKNYGKV